MKVKFFPIMSVSSGEQSINNWLSKNTNIEIVSVNAMSYNNTLVIVYKELDIGSDSDEVD